MLVSDWKLRKLLPPEVRHRSNSYKTMCLCLHCLCPYESASYKPQSQSQVVEAVEAGGGCFETRIKNRKITFDKYHEYKDKSNASKTVSDALKEVHCKRIPVDSEDLNHARCAFKRCDRCPKFKQPSLEESCEEYISFQMFEIVNYCT